MVDAVGNGPASTYNVPTMLPALPAEYWHTTYFAETPVGHLRLRVGLDDWPANVMLTRQHLESWAFITAWNPGGQIASPNQNQSRNAALSARLANFPSYPGRGVGDFDTHTEDSFLVLGISESEALTLAREFGQNAILFGRLNQTPELIDCRE